MDIIPGGSRPSMRAPAEYFTGTVRQDPVIEAAGPARVRAVSVTFEPGARTAWHTHPLGQTLVVTAGRGLVQSWGGRCRRFVWAMSSGSRRAKSTGTVPHPIRPWSTLRFRRRSTARLWIGWNMSATSSIAAASAAAPTDILGFGGLAGSAEADGGGYRDRAR